MGNECCSNRNPDREGFTAEETNMVTELFENLCAQNGSTSTKLTKDSMKPLFPENPYFAEKLFQFMKYNNKAKKIVDLETFVRTLEVLIKPLRTQKDRQFTKERLDKIDIFTMISIYVKNDYPTEPESDEYIKDILRIFLHGTKRTEVDNSAMIILREGAFRLDNDAEFVDWFKLVSYLRTHLPDLNKIIEIYFETKFLHRHEQGRIILPEFNQQSNMLNQDMFSILCATKKIFQSAARIDLVFNSNIDGLNFDKLAYELKNYPFSTLMLLRLSDPNEKSRSPKNSYVIGAFTKISWMEGLTSDSDASLFSIFPRYRFLPALKDSLEKENLYLNTDIQNGPKGLGFGNGTRPENFRIWIDGKNPNKVFVSNEDGIYRTGSLTVSNSKVFEIRDIEVWGLGIESTLAISNKISSKGTKTKKYVQVERVKSSGVPKSAEMRYTTPSSGMYQTQEVKTVNQTTVYANRNSSIQFTPSNIMIDTSGLNKDYDIDKKFDEIGKEIIQRYSTTPKRQRLSASPAMRRDGSKNTPYNGYNSNNNNLLQDTKPFNTQYRTSNIQFDSSPRSMGFRPNNTQQENNTFSMTYKLNNAQQDNNPFNIPYKPNMIQQDNTISTMAYKPNIIPPDTTSNTIVYRSNNFSSQPDNIPSNIGFAYKPNITPEDKTNTTTTVAFKPSNNAAFTVDYKPFTPSQPFMMSSPDRGNFTLNNDNMN